MYRVSHLLKDWVGLNFECSTAWADGNLAEVAGQPGKMVEHPNQSQPNPGPQADGTPCIQCILREDYRCVLRWNHSGGAISVSLRFPGTNFQSERAADSAAINLLSAEEKERERD